MKILARTEVQFNDNGTPNDYTMSGCEFYRQFLPFEHLRQTHNIEVGYTNDIDHPELNAKDFDLYHFVRKDIKLDKDGNWNEAGNLQRAKDAGLPIVMDIDDLWRLDSTHALYNYYKQQKVDKLTEGWLRDSDAVITTTERLAEYIYKINKNVHVAPNCIHPVFNSYSWSEADKTESDKVRIGWVGGRHHLNDMRKIEGFFELFWKDSISDVATTVMGGYNHGDMVLRTIHAIMCGKSPKGIKHSSVIETMDAYNFANMYKHIDIALAPLADNAFNKCKSELKIIEAGWFGIPVIASDIYPYNTVIEHGYNGYLVKGNETGKTWLKYVKELVEDDVLRYHMGQNLKQTIRERFDLGKANEVRYNVYSGLTGKS